MNYSAQNFAGQGRPNNFTQQNARSPQGASAAAGTARQVRPIRPVTIKQLLEAQRVGDGITVIDGREVTQVCVVGRISQFEAQAPTGAMTARHHGYIISDGTGSLLVRQWFEQDKEAPPQLPLNSFLRASGNVKVWQERPLVTGSARPIADCNELTFHFLDAVLTHLRITRGGRPSKSQQLEMRELTEAGRAAPPSAANALGGLPLRVGAGEKIYCSDVVLHLIKHSGKVDGVTVDELVKGAAPYQFGVQDVRTALRALSKEAKVFEMDRDRFSA
jgi:replication factor A2